MGKGLAVFKFEMKAVNIVLTTEIRCALQAPDHVNTHKILDVRREETVVGHSQVARSCVKRMSYVLDIDTVDQALPEPESQPDVQLLRSLSERDREHTTQVAILHN